MAKLTESSVTRHIDTQGNEIKAYLDDDGSFIQAVVLADQFGNQAALSGNPLYISLTGAGLSGNPLWIKSRER